MFCADCLGTALNMENTRRVCPICRQKIDEPPNQGKFSQRARGFYALELKLATKSRTQAGPSQPSQVTS